MCVCAFACMQRSKIVRSCEIDLLPSCQRSGLMWPLIACSKRKNAYATSRHGWAAWPHRHHFMSSASFLGAADGEPGLHELCDARGNRRPFYASSLEGGD